MKYKPYDLGVWLEDLDVNGLSDDDASALAAFDPASDQGLDRIIHEWVRPRFEKWDSYNQSQMLEVLASSRKWSSDELEPLYAEFQFPGFDVDFGRVVEALRKHFLG
ncbi:MAG TPA: hypothetical protein VEB59_11360 [Gemmatimonadales bacterium]|nr:hypothetical protein [Gemmatimonadales bacterium]